MSHISRHIEKEVLYLIGKFPAVGHAFQIVGTFGAHHIQIPGLSGPFLSHPPPPFLPYQHPETSGKSAQILLAG